MTDPVTALVIAPDGAAELREVVPDLDPLRALIGGGWLEDVARGDGGTADAWHAYADEDGLLRGLPENTVASVVVSVLGWNLAAPLVGSVVFLGASEEDEEVSVPARVVAVTERIVGALR